MNPAPAPTAVEAAERLGNVAEDETPPCLRALDPARARRIRTISRTPDRFSWAPAVLQLTETMMLHLGLDQPEADRRAVELLDLPLDPPECADPGHMSE